MRIYVEKKKEFQASTNSLKSELKNNLGLEIENLRLVNVYDIDISEELYDYTKYKIFGEITTDDVRREFNYDENFHYIEYIPASAEKRIEAVKNCFYLIDSNFNIELSVSKILVVDKKLNEEELNKLKGYFSLKYNYRTPKEDDGKELIDDVVEGFIELENKDYESFIKNYNLGINKNDLKAIIEYFKLEKRNPTLVELKLIDTYWSDHCRHTTFNTKITDIQIDRSFLSSELNEALDLYIDVRKDLKRDNRRFSLMDMATIGAKYLKRVGKLNDLVKNGETNAFSLKTDVTVDGKKEKWILQFKNETNNHPTEMDPFNGAANCIGGTARDLIADRARIFQGMRISGAADIYKNPNETIEGKLPQRIISTNAAFGASNYANLAGIPTSYVREIYHDDYVAKRLESSLLVGASKVSDVRRERPKDGDFILLVGNKTNIEGVGSAVMSSQEHNATSLKNTGLSLQSANPSTASKFARLMRRKEATRLIKKANDLGAGGIGVGVSELYSGVEIWLDDVLVKNNKINTLDLLLSETQERIAIVVSPEEKDELINYIKEEDLFVSYVGKITNSNEILIYHKGKVVARLSRKFIDSAGALRYASAVIGSVKEENPFITKAESLEDRVFNTLSDNNILSEQGLVNLFDYTIGRSTVLLPYGGKYQRTETQVSAIKLPVDGFTKKTSLLAYGFNPYLTSWSPYHGAEYAIIESITKLVASGVDYKNIRLSFQEYFEKMKSAESWGKATAAMLGALKIEMELKIPSIGGKDSMAGSFNKLNVPPTFISYAFSTLNDDEIITPEFKSRGHKLYLVKHNENKNFTPNIEQLIDNYEFVNYNIKKGHIVSAYALGAGGLIAACAKMSMGNSVGFYLNVKEEELNKLNYGSIICEVQGNLEIPDDINPNFILVGRTSHVQYGVINKIKFSIPSMKEVNTKKYNKVFKNSYDTPIETTSIKMTRKKVNLLKNKTEVKVFFPLFDGINCDLDLINTFKELGAITTSFKFKGDKYQVNNSINELVRNINETDILVFSGGYSGNDEPDGSGKYVANIINEPRVKEAIENLIARKGLILGVCNGFQALIKSGLLPYGKIGQLNEESPSLIKNELSHHVSKLVYSKVTSNASPWLCSYKTGEILSIPLSCSEGKFVSSKKLINDLIKNGQVALVYSYMNGDMADNYDTNPTGSAYAVEGLLSPDGLIFGLMGHPERYQHGLYKNFNGRLENDFFKNAINYFKKDSRK